jgi:3-oxoadipate enol-lactonase
VNPAGNGPVRVTGGTGGIDLGAVGLRYAQHRSPAHAGAGRPPALLLHPWFGCGAMWEPLALRLDVTSYAVDWYSLAEAGDRATWTPWASPDGLARAAVALLDEQRLDRVDVIGNSVGGIVAQILAADHPGRVRRLVLIGTGAALGGPPTAFGALVGRWIEHPAERAGLAVRLVDALVAQPLAAADRDRYVAAVLAADPEFVAAVLRTARDTDLRPRLGAITAPTLVMRGEHDTARTRRHVAELVAGIADARSVELPGCGHSPMVEEPDLVASLVLSHLR